VTESSNNSLHRVFRNMGVIAGGLERCFSVYAKAGTRTIAYLNFWTGSNNITYFDLSGGTVLTSASGNNPVITDAGNGWYRISVARNGNAGGDNHMYFGLASADNTPTYLGNGTGSVYGWGFQLNRGYIPTPYLATTTAARRGIPLSYDAAAAQYGVWVEPAATNLCLRSQEFDNGSWGMGSVQSVSANATTAPDGSSTADLLNVTGTDAVQGYIQQQVSAAAGAITSSAYVKYTTSQYIALSIYDGSHHFSWFDIQNGTMGTQNGSATNTITAVGDGWYRISTTYTTGAVNPYTTFYAASTDNSISVTAADGAYIWGAQIETGSVATSYIPTLGATVARAVDDAYALVSTFPFADSSPGTLYVYAKPFFAGSTAPNSASRYLNLGDDGTLENNIIIYHLQSDGEDYFDVASGPTAQGPISDNTTTAANVARKIAASWDTNDLAASKNGAAAATDTTATMPATSAIDSLVIGNRNAADRPFNGLIYHVVYLPRDMSDAELVTRAT
jgi:hypothetical protein